MNSLVELTNYLLLGEDGELGRVENYLLDDHAWQVRYLICEAGEWYQGRRFLVSVKAISQLNPEDETVTLRVDREKIRSVPNIQDENSLTRQEEAELHSYFGWPFYWEEDNSIGPGVMSYPLIELASEISNKMEAITGEEAPSLHRLDQIVGCGLQARDGAIGKIIDLVSDLESWRVLYLVVDTGGMFGGRQALVSPAWVTAVDWPAMQVLVDLKKETIQKSPAYDPELPIDPDYEHRLSEYYKTDRAGL